MKKVKVKRKRVKVVPQVSKSSLNEDQGHEVDEGKSSLNEDQGAEVEEGKSSMNEHQGAEVGEECAVEKTKAKPKAKAKAEPKGCGIAQRKHNFDIGTYRTCEVVPYSTRNTVGLKLKKGFVGEDGKVQAGPLTPI